MDCLSTIIIEIDNNVITLLLHTNLSPTLIYELNTSKAKELNITNSFSIVKSNIQIAAAVTSYARIQMIPYKLRTDCYYSVTDYTFSSR